MRNRRDLRCLICVFPVLWDVRVLACNASLLRNRGTSVVAQHMELARGIHQNIRMRLAG